MAKDKKGCAGCLMSIVAIVLAISLLGSCGGETEPEATPEVEGPAVVQEQIQEEGSSENVSNLDTEKEPKQEVIELEPVFIDPFGGSEDEMPEEPAQEAEIPSTETQQPVTPEPEHVTPELPAVQEPTTEPPAEPEPETPAVSDPLSGAPSISEPEPVPEPEVVEPHVTNVPAETDSTIVYITETGRRYHRGGCRHLAESKIETTLDAAAAAGLTPCGTCY